MNSNKDEINNSLEEIKKQFKYLKENKETLENKKRDEYKNSQMELIKNGIEEMKTLKEKNLSDKEIIKSSIMMLKIITILTKLHHKDYEEKTLIIMIYIQLCLTLDDKSDLKYTELLEKIFYESLFDKSFIEEMPEYLTNEKICSCFENMLEYLK